MSQQIKILLATVAILAVLAGGVWYFFLRVPAVQNTTPATQGGSFFGSGVAVTVAPKPAAQNNVPITLGTSNPNQMIFKVAEGPVAGATLIQTLHPTTTIARYATATDGHVFDLALDSPGAVPRTVSNTTIPGIARALWVESGGGAVLRYVDGNVVKSVYLQFRQSATSTNASPARIQFLPDAIVDIATSPDGKSLAYLLKVASGVNGFVAKSDGTASKQLFSLPLSQVLLSWPAAQTLLAQTRAAAGVSGIVFSVDAKTGAAVPLVYAPGISALGDRTFSRLVYQTVNEAGSRASYSHDVKKGGDTPLSFDPFPEKCRWSNVSTTTLYCAAPLAYVPGNYLDLWHMGTASAADSLFSFNVSAGQSRVLAIPGSKDGGTQTDIAEIAVSPDDHYLLFISKGDRSLWAVRL